jgi:hypothetical protein
MDGRALGTMHMHMDMILTAEDALQAARMILSWEVHFFYPAFAFLCHSQPNGGQQKGSSGRGLKPPDGLRLFENPRSPGEARLSK